MKLNLLSTYFLMVVAALLGSCRPFDPDDSTPPKQTEGWAPIYSQAADAIGSTDARTIENGGKIYIKDDRLYQIESGKGIHVINISDKANPEKIAFIEVIGCQEMSIAGKTLYTNNLNDLVTIDISDINNVVEKDRKKDAFHILDKGHPPARGWFECIDPSKGEVIGWEMKTLYSPKCLY